MNQTPDTKTITANISAICARFGIAVQTRVTGAGTKTRYVDMPGQTVDRAMASEALVAIAKEMTRAHRGAETMIYTLASQIVAKAPAKKARP